MKSVQAIQLINLWKNNCYLSDYSFDCPVCLIDDALIKFQSDSIFIGTPAINKNK